MKCRFLPTLFRSCFPLAFLRGACLDACACRGSARSDPDGSRARRRSSRCGYSRCTGGCPRVGGASPNHQAGRRKEARHFFTPAHTAASLPGSARTIRHCRAGRGTGTSPSVRVHFPLAFSRGGGRVGSASGKPGSKAPAPCGGFFLVVLPSRQKPAVGGSKHLPGLDSEIMDTEPARDCACFRLVAQRGVTYIHGIGRAPGERRSSRRLPPRSSGRVDTLAGNTASFSWQWPSAGRRSWREQGDGQGRIRRLTETRGPLEAELCGDSGRLSLPRRRPSASRLPSLGKRLARHLPMFGKNRADLPNIGKIPLALRATRGPAAPQRGDGAEKGDPACGITEKRAFWARFPFRTMTFRPAVTR